MLNKPARDLAVNQHAAIHAVENSISAIFTAIFGILRQN